MLECITYASFRRSMKTCRDTANLYCIWKTPYGPTERTCRVPRRAPCHRYDRRKPILGHKGRWRGVRSCWCGSELPDCCHSRDVKSVASVQLVQKCAKYYGNRRCLPYTSSAYNDFRSSTRYRFATEPTIQRGPNVSRHGTTGRP